MLRRARVKRNMASLPFNLVWLILPFSSNAYACSCAGAQILGVTPEDLSKNVPTNAIVRVVSIWGDVYADDVSLDCNGEEIAHTLDVQQSITQSILIILPNEHLPQQTYCELYINTYRMTSFTTGTDADDTPPVWSGALSVDLTKYRDEGHTCGTWKDYYGISIEDFSDDTSDDNNILFTLKPQDVEGETVWAFGSEIGISTSDYCDGDYDMAPTMGMRRKYDVYAQDVAGNNSDRHTLVISRCGCASSPPSSGGSAILMCLFFVGFLRRRDSPS